MVGKEFFEFEFCDCAVFLEKLLVVLEGVCFAVQSDRRQFVDPSAVHWASGDGDWEKE